MLAEKRRLNFVLRRDGREAAIAFAKRGMETYHAAIASPTYCGEVRLRMAEAIATYEMFLRVYG